MMKSGIETLYWKQYDEVKDWDKQKVGKYFSLHTRPVTECQRLKSLEQFPTLLWLACPPRNESTHRHTTGLRVWYNPVYVLVGLFLQPISWTSLGLMVIGGGLAVLYARKLKREKEAG